MPAVNVGLFASSFNMEWEEAIRAGCVLSAKKAMERLKCSPKALSDMCRQVKERRGEERRGEEMGGEKWRWEERRGRQGEERRGRRGEERRGRRGEARREEGRGGGGEAREARAEKDGGRAEAESREGGEEMKVKGR
eukprot:687302-Hanusia_phi.AAC.2